MSDGLSRDVDQLDLAILAHLQEDGRKSFTEIANALGVAVGTVSNRLRNMVANNTVRIIPRVDPQRVGFSAPATINISVEPALLEEAIDEIATFPEVSWLASIAGDYDLVVDVMCCDITHLKTFISQRLAKVSGVRDMTPYLYLQIHKIALPDLDLVKRRKTPDQQENNTYTPR